MTLSPITSFVSFVEKDKYYFIISIHSNIYLELFLIKASLDSMMDWNLEVHFFILIFFSK